MTALEHTDLFLNLSYINADEMRINACAAKAANQYNTHFYHFSTHFTSEGFAVLFSTQL